jgi:hypothetical protein
MKIEHMKSEHKCHRCAVDFDRGWAKKMVTDLLPVVQLLLQRSCALLQPSPRSEITAHLGGVYIT